MTDSQAITDTPTIPSASRIYLNRITLKTFGGVEHEIKALVKHIVVYEDMFSSFLTCEIAMLDANDLIRIGPIIGEEKLTIEFRSPYVEEYTKIEFRVTGTGAIGNATENSEVYAIKCISASALTSMTQLLSKAYTNKTVSTIVKDLIGTINVDGKNVEVAETVDQHSYIVPNVEVMTAINTMIPRARHKDHASGSAFVFFEDLDRFVFDSMEAMYDQEPIADLSDAVKNLMSTSEASTVLNFEKKIMDVLFDRLVMIERGAFANECIWFDPIAKGFGKTGYSYKKDYDKTNHPPGIDKTKKTAFKLVTDESEFTDTPSKTFLVCTSNAAKQIPYASQKGVSAVNLSKNKETTIPFRTAQINQMLGALKLRLELIGNDNIRVGKTVTVNLKTTGSDKSEPVNSLLSGVYLITAVKRNLYPFYHVTIELSRDSYAEDHKTYMEKLKRDAAR